MKFKVQNPKLKVRSSKLKVRRASAVMLLLIVASTMIGSAQLSNQAECPYNLLVNPGFEDGYSYRPDPYAPEEGTQGELYVANGWELWYDNVPGQGGYNYRPEYRPEDGYVFTDPLRVRSGRYAHKMFTTFSTHTAGLYQRAKVPEGSQVEFSIWVEVWSSEEDDPHHSTSPGKYWVSVGIDPYGGTDAFSEQIVWSDRIEHYDEHVQLSVTAVAQADHVTVFTKGAPEWPVRYNDSYWDDACLIVNPLQNPDLEESYSARVDPYAPGEGPKGDLTLADGWELWYMPGQGIYNRRPRYQPEDEWRRVRSGRFAQKLFTTDSTHTAGFYQQVPVPEGSEVTFTIWVQVWSSSYDDPNESRDPGNYRTYVGIDPFGGTDWQSGAIIWSEPLMIYDQWVELDISAVAQTDHITLFTKGAPEWPVKHNDSHWDDARLIIHFPFKVFLPLVLKGYGTPIPTATPTATSTSTPTPTNSPTPTSTPTPTDTPTNTPTPSLTATATATPTATPTTTPTATPITPTPTPVTPTTTATATYTVVPPPTATLTPYPSGANDPDAWEHKVTQPVLFVSSNRSYFKLPGLASALDPETAESTISALPYQQSSSSVKFVILLTLKAIAP